MGCPSPEDLAAFAVGGVDEAVARHLTICDECARIADALRHTTATEVDSDVTDEARRCARRGLETLGHFLLLRQLGAGGMGVVYEAYDQQREGVVALKTLRRIDPASLYLFKQEFRALADVTHPNLVTLYELLAEDDQWFFTMELLYGTNLLVHLRGGREPPAIEPVVEGAIDRTCVSPTRRLGDGPARNDSYAPAAAAAIRPLIAQLARGLNALHRAGFLHCDVKPSNVLVTTAGRVVLLDYGLITDAAGRRGVYSGIPIVSSPGAQVFRGTPAYAAPEQAAGDTPTAASDWYAVGVILYEALTGRRPYAGSPRQVLAAKQVEDPLPVTQLVPDADPRLARLCTDLMARVPEDRPSGADILGLLAEGDGERRRRRHVTDALAIADDTHTLVGRNRQLARLRELFDQSRAGSGIAVRVEGRSGMGKTALVLHLLDELDSTSQALVLAGRCYERESVPYQAIDGLVDSLCRFLLALPRDDAERVMPVDVQAMARAFPVLERVDAVAQACRLSAVTGVDPVELRRRAHGALRQLLAHIAERQPLVLFIDDLQWGDVDSAPFLADLLRPPVPPLLLVVTYRSEEADASPLLRALLARDGDTTGALANADRIAVSRLSIPEARSLAEDLLDAAGAPVDAAEQIARESEGNPLFVHELVRHIATGNASPDRAVPQLAEVVLARAAALSEDAGELLRVVAVAGKPLSDGVARLAARIGEHHQRAVAELRAARLARTSSAAQDTIIETYHDRIRDSIIGNLSPAARAALHSCIAEALVATAATDPEALALHYAGAGQRAPAARYAALAGDKASAALAFERAAMYYRHALDHCDQTDHSLLASLGRRLGDALVNAGRGADSPPVYLAAAEVAEPADARDLQVRAGSELLRSGRVEDGVEVLRAPLASAGISLARSKLGAALSLLLRRGHTRLRGLRFARRAVDEVAPEVLTEIDACHAAATGLGMVDPLRGAYVQSRHLMAALNTGDAFRAARALTYEGAFLCIAGASARPRVDGILHTVAALAADLDDPYLNALHHTHAALAEYQSGDWSAALTHAQTADATYRSQCSGCAFERASSQLFAIWSLYWLGELRELDLRTRESLRDARDRGDLYATVCLNVGLPAFTGLLADDVEGTRARTREAAAQWVHNDYHLQHYWTALALTNCDLYVGDPVAAFDRIDAEWPKLRRAFLLRVSVVRAENLHLAARCALAAARATGAAGMWKQAARRARHLARQRMPWCVPAARLIEAGIEYGRGRSSAAVELLEAAEQGLGKADTRALACAARYRRGQLIGGAHGAALVAEAEQWIRAQGGVNAPALLAFFAPGFD